MLFFCMLTFREEHSAGLSSDLGSQKDYSRMAFSSPTKVPQITFDPPGAHRIQSPREATSSAPSVRQMSSTVGKLQYRLLLSQWEKGNLQRQLQAAAWNQQQRCWAKGHPAFFLLERSGSWKKNKRLKWVLCGGLGVERAALNGMFCCWICCCD